MRIADLLCAVVRVAVEIGVDVAVRGGEGQTAAQLEYRRDRPAIEDGAEHGAAAAIAVTGAS